MDRAVDPVTHATFLSALHQATIITEDTGRLLQKIVGEEIEPVIAERRACFSTRPARRTELDACVTRFENALNRMRTAHEALKGSVGRIEEIGEKFPCK